MPDIIFEHPLNEKIRMMLRIETLITQLSQLKSVDSLNDAIPFFKALCDLLCLTERLDLRAEFLKELDKQQYKINNELNKKQQNIAQLEENSIKIQLLIEKVVKFNNRLGNKILHDPLIQAIKQRINIPYGYCSFDLPQLYVWLAHSPETRNNTLQHWKTELTLVEKCTTLILQLIRDSAQFTAFEYHSNFFQETRANFELLRIRLSNDTGVYPQISGNRSRFMIRFVDYHNQTTSHKTHYFELACC